MAEFVFSFTTEDYVPPFLRNRDPADAAIGVNTTAPIMFDILDDVGVVPTSISVYVGGGQAYDGYNFLVPFTGTVVPTVVDGYDGYHFRILGPMPNSSWVSVRVVAKDTSALTLDETWRFYTTAALVELLQGPYEITLDARFSGPMLLSSLLDASRYQFTEGAYARYIEPIPSGESLPTNIRLWVERFDGTEPITLTVSSQVLDAYGNALADDSRTATISPFPSAALYSNAAGLVRSWHESRIILSDTKRAYLAGIRGLDVFNITNGPTDPIRWAQILDAYGVSAACLLSTADYDFEDTVAPFLTGRIPAPGASGVSITTNIRMMIADADTSVEPVAVAIYVNGRLAFGGTTGWMNGYGGNVLVGHQYLSVQLFPPSGGLVVGLNTVAVMAADLAGNTLDTSYTFTVGAPLPGSGGFGEGTFGEFPFGE